MPNEPEHKMDSPLKAYARQRREAAGGDFELHPANRRLLQAEAAKLRPPPSAPRGSWLRALAVWPRVALAVSAIVMLAGVTWILVPRPDAPAEMQIARLNEQDRLETLKRESKLVEDEVDRDGSARKLDKPPGVRSLAAVPAAAGETTRLAESAPKPDGLRRDELKLARSLDRKETTLELGVQPVPADPTSRSRRLAAPDAADARRVAQTGDKDGVVQTNVSGVAYGFTLADASAKDSPLGQPRPAAPPAPSAPASGPALFFNGAAITNPADTSAPANVGLKNETARAGAANAVAGGRGVAADAYGVNREGTVTQGGASVALRQAGQTAQAAEQSARFYRLQQAPAQPARAIRDRAAPPATAVLNNFQWQQAGNAIRIVDGDNSVYSGMLIDEESATGLAGKPVSASVETETLEKRKAQTPALQAVQQSEARTQAWFRVSGLNRTLNESVVFEGNFLAAPVGADLQQTVADQVQNAPLPAATPPPVVAPPQEPAVRQLNESRSRQSQSQVQNQWNIQNQRGRIQGTLRIGNEAPVPVEALPVEPPR